MTLEDYPGRGQLPDALAFVKPNRARAYVALKDADEPLTADELADVLECSLTTAYRCMNDLTEIGLICESIRLGAQYSQTRAYTTTTKAKPWDRARADGGTDR